MAIHKSTKSLKLGLEKRINNAEKELKQHVQRATILVEGEAKRSILSGGTGITYQKYNPRRSHTASSAGNPPASDTGFLVSQITSKVGIEDTSVVGKIIASAPYSIHLEYGTTDMQARPFMQPALRKKEGKIEQIFQAGGYLKK